MKNVIKYTLPNLRENQATPLPHYVSYIEKHSYEDSCGSKLTILSVNNGLLSFTILPERGMDIGEIYYQEEKISWERDLKYLIHPSSLNLYDNNSTGWLKGFYPAVASIGPELFGTPGEGLTLHGTGSYSSAVNESVLICADENKVFIEATVPVKGYEDHPLFEKRIKILTRYLSPIILREETTRNLSDKTMVLDDGLHIQLCGKYLFEGGRFVLPVKKRYLLLRDSAPPEADPLRIIPVNRGRQPIRCYQYVPEPVFGLEGMADISDYMPLSQNNSGITAEMIINDANDTAAYLVRQLDCFPRSLIAKEISDTPMFSLEPCRTRPNRLSQKITDGEAYFLEPGCESKTVCLIGSSKNLESIKALEKMIQKAAGE